MSTGRRVAIALMEFSPTEVSHELGVARSTVYQHIGRCVPDSFLRASLRAAGPGAGADPVGRRIKVNEPFGTIRPEVWVSDMLGSQRGHGVLWQVCLAHLLRDAKYAIECGDTAFSAPFRW